MNFAVIHTPIGYLRLVEEEKFLTEISYISSAARAIPPKTPLLVQVAKQLEEYFNGSRYVFDLPIKFSGGAYQQKVLQALQRVPYGSTISYKELAGLAGNEKAARAVGTTMKNNPLVILIPCHRVLPTSGGIGQYSAGGTCNKEWLLTLEKQNL